MRDNASDGSRPSCGDREQLRLALVLNGGVSLAIWMGGACHEVDRLTRREGAYALLLDWVRSDARVDVISGTSAGGINGAALALSQANARSQGLGMLRDVWLESGSFASLLRQPFHGQPPSLLQGDEYFLPQLGRAFRALAEPYTPTDVHETPIDLTITATLLQGVPTVTVDHAGQRISQKRHDGLFRFQRGATHRDGRNEDDFAAHLVSPPGGGASPPSVLDALALAARTTASYPVAFEPSFLPTTPELAAAVGDGRHPDMSPYLTGAWQRPLTRYSRYAVDGGVLANTPTRPALKAIDAMPAEGLVRRVLLLVHPHAPSPQQDAHERPEVPPTVAAVGGSVLGALTSEGSRNFVQLIDEHNRLAGGRREMRAEVVQLPLQRGSASDLASQARLSYPWYRVLRTRRAARDLAGWWVDRPGALEGESFPRTYQQLLDLLQRAPGWMPTAGDEVPAPELLGFEGALGVADAAVDYLRRVIWQAVCSGADDAVVAPVCQARAQVSAARHQVLDAYGEFIASVRARAADPAATDLSAWLQAVLTAYSSTEIQALLALQTQTIAAQVALVHVAVAADDASADAVVLRGFNDVLDAGHASPEQVLARLTQVQVLTYVLSDEVTTGNALPIDLVQLTYQVQHPFASSLSGEQKVAGDMLSRFSAFLKRSWRVNDWAWGRLDASATLCRLVLEPSRVRRFVEAERRGAETFAQTAARQVADLFTAVPHLPGLPSQQQVVDEVAALDTSGASAPLMHLPAVFAALLACEVAGEEMPELVRAVDQDDIEGANPRARGSVAVKANRAVLAGAATADAPGRWAALDAFAASGVGGESPGSEGSSDQLIGTATNAAAAGVTLLDSPRAGLGFLSPVTRTVRGAALLPYWTVTGLTTGGAVARSLAIIAMATGAVLLTLGMVGIGPAWGIAVGAAALLGGFAYGALRTGTALHSAVLLVPAVVLLAWAAQGDRSGGDDEAASTGASGATAAPLSILLAVVLLVGGLIVLGSLRPPMRSPLAFVGAGRWGTLAVVVAAAVALALLLTPELRSRLGAALAAAGAWVGGLPPAVVGAALGALVGLALAWVLVGGWLAYRAGTSWRMVVLEARPTPGGAPVRTWGTHQVEHPAGTTSGWSWVYGMVAIGAALLVLAWFGFSWPGASWGRAALVGLAAGAALLLLPVPWWLDRGASRRLHEQLVGVFTRLPATASQQQQAQAVFAAGLNYQRLLNVPVGTVPPDDVWAGVELSAAGRDAWSDVPRQ